MHLGNGAVTPSCAVFALGVAAVGVGAAVVAPRLMRRQAVSAKSALALGALVFAAQMFNVTVLPYSSAHWIGGALLAWVLGPPVAILTMGAVLATQALLLGDGDVGTLGLNLINMGIAPALVVAAVGGKWRGERWSAKSTAALAGIAFLSTVVGAALVVLEVSLAHGGPLAPDMRTFTASMFASHAIAGLFEAALTVAIAAVIAQLAQRQGAAVTPPGWALSPLSSAAIVAVSLVVVVLSGPTWGLASSLPDGLEAAILAQGSEFASLTVETGTSPSLAVAIMGAIVVAALAGLAATLANRLGRGDSTSGRVLTALFSATRGQI